MGFIQTLPDPQNWMVEFPEGTIYRLPGDSEDAKKTLKALENLPGYTKT